MIWCCTIHVNTIGDNEQPVTCTDLSDLASVPAAATRLDLHRQMPTRTRRLLKHVDWTLAGPQIEIVVSEQEQH